MNRLGDKIKKGRQAKGYSQEQLANKIGVSRTSITGYERCTITPSVTVLKKLCLELDLDFWSLVSLAQLPNKHDRVVDLYKSINMLIDDVRMDTITYKGSEIKNDIVLQRIQDSLKNVKDGIETLIKLL